MPRADIDGTADPGGRHGVPLPWIALVAGVAIAVYLNSLGGALLYDDVNAITQNALVREGDVGGILTTPSWWGDGRGTLWRPLTTLSFALDHALYGLAPFGYHAANVALHAVASVLVLLVFAAAGVAPVTAWAAALLFAAHPVHTEAVAGVVGRAELLATLGFFLAWRCWLAAGAEDAASSTHTAGWTLAATVLYFLALLGKESALALPAVLLGADAIAHPDARWQDLVRRRWPRYAALLAAALVFLALRTAVLGGVMPAAELLDNPLASLPPLPRAMTAVAVLGRYALRLVFPLRLSADYSYDQIPAVHAPTDGFFVAGLAVIVAGAALTWWAWRRLPALALGIVLLALTFAPLSNLFFGIGTIMGERLLYLPSAGFCLAGAAGLAAWADAPGTAPLHRSPRLLVPLGIMLALFGARTVARNPVWHEPLVFFRTMTADAPRSARSHAELASALAEAGRFDEADAAFARALAIHPDDPTIHYNRGHALMTAGRWDAAADAYRRAIVAKPDFGRAFENLGNVESARGDQQAALAALRRAQELTPDSPYLLLTIANVLARAGAIAEAGATYERALAARPGDSRIVADHAAFLRAHGEPPPRP